MFSLQKKGMSLFDLIRREKPRTVYALIVARTAYPNPDTPAGYRVYIVGPDRIGDWSFNSFDEMIEFVIDVLAECPWESDPQIVMKKVWEYFEGRA